MGIEEMERRAGLREQDTPPPPWSTGKKIVVVTLSLVFVAAVFFVLKWLDDHGFYRPD